jgi:hypothetical protein
MAAELSPETEARLDDLAKRIGYFGPNARDQILKIALDGLDAKTPPPTPKMTPEEKKMALEKLEELGAAGRRWREEHPDEYDENYPPSLAWQDELYDEFGLPK